MNDKQAFIQFYDTYAPKLWGLILLANLSSAQSEAILTRTLIKGWEQLGKDSLRDERVLSILISLARREGLPCECLKTIPKPRS